MWNPFVEIEINCKTQNVKLYIAFIVYYKVNYFCESINLLFIFSWKIGKLVS